MPNSNTRDHLANERTFLAWIRTSIGIMVFGFVFEKFSLFLRHFPLLDEKIMNVKHFSESYFIYFGVLLVVLGLLVCMLAFIKYRRIEKQIDDNAYHSSRLLDIVLTAAVLIIGITLIFFLYKGI
jgi:uncharacterized membrane protein YidH (DUF202 family)